MATGYTDIRITHEQNDVFIDTTSKPRTMDELLKALHAIESGFWVGSIAVTQNGGSGVAASGTVAFSGAATAGDTVTINGQALTAQKEYASGTITFDALDADDTITVGATTFTAKETPSGAIQFALGEDDTEAAANAVAKINAHPTAGALVTAYSTGAVITLRSKTRGTVGNGVTAIASSDGTDAAVGGDASGGFLAGASAAGNNKFDVGYTAAEAGAALMAAVNGSTTDLINDHVRATHDGEGEVTLTALDETAEGNAVTLAKSGSAIEVSGTRLTGGADTTPGTLTY